MAETVNREKLLQFLGNVDQEIANMCSGEGRHRTGVLHFEQGKNSCPVMNRLNVLKEAPTQKNLDLFLELAAQDFGAPTADFFRGMSQAIFTQDTPQKVPFKKAFDVSIKDAFYDMFRTARIPMEPKQVERIEAIALGLAKTLQEEIKSQVTEDVKTHVKVLLAILREEVAASTVTQVKLATKEICASIDAKTEAEGALESVTTDPAVEVSSKNN